MQHGVWRMKFGYRIHTPDYRGSKTGIRISDIARGERSAEQGELSVE